MNVRARAWQVLFLLLIILLFLMYFNVPGPKHPNAAQLERAIVRYNNPSTITTTKDPVLDNYDASALINIDAATETKDVSQKKMETEIQRACSRFFHVETQTQSAFLKNADLQKRKESLAIHPNVQGIDLQDNGKGHPFFLLSTVMMKGYPSVESATQACQEKNAELASLTDIQKYTTSTYGSVGRSQIRGTGGLQYTDFGWVRREIVDPITVEVARPYPNDSSIQTELADSSKLPLGPYEIRKLTKYPKVQGGLATPGRRYPALCKLN